VVRAIFDRVRAFGGDRGGVTGLEYALLAGLMAVAILTGAHAVGGHAAGSFADAAGKYQAASSSGGAPGAAGVAPSSAGSSGGGGSAAVTVSRGAHP